jgi:signal transduction histidine kinase
VPTITPVPERNGVPLYAAIASLAASLEASREELERQKSELEAVLDATTESICMTDRDGGILHTNAAMERLARELDLPRSGPIWDRIAALARRTPEPERYVSDFAAVAVDPERTYTDEFVVDGERAFVGFTGPVRDAAGSLVGRIFTLREVTSDRAVNRLKDEFVATVSHELRTPLTSIIGYLELVLAGEAGSLTEEQKQFLEVVDRNAGRLLGLVGDLLFVAQVEGGLLALERRPVDLQRVVSDAVAAARPLAEEKELDLRVDADAIDELWGDEQRLAQVLDNLVGNAIKFTPAGGRVCLRVRADESRAVIEVEDTGIGIPEGERERLFERFFRTSLAQEQAIPGSGLGLSVARMIVQGHGGRIDVESTEGEGSTFRVELPIRTPDRHSEAPAPA